MPSPFPGMNPYLEQKDVWEEFHHNFIARMHEHLVKVVGPRYLVKAEVRLYLHEIAAEERSYFGKADVGLVKEPHPNGGTALLTAEVSAPTCGLQFPNVEIERHPYLEIRDRERREVVTCLELLSPSNKRPGADRDDYLAKRANTLGCSVSFVEIDLTRGGQRPQLPVLPKSDYYVLVSRSEDWPEAHYWSIPLHEPLPTIPIPRRAPDEDVPLALQTVLHQVYDAFDYGKYIYQGTPEPPLSEQDQAWANQFIPSRTP